MSQTVAIITPAYKAAGAAPMDEWTVFRLTDDALRSFAAGGPTA